MELHYVGISAAFDRMRRRGLWGGARNAARLCTTGTAFTTAAAPTMCWAAGNASTRALPGRNREEAMLEGGFILLHRSILRWEWYGDLNTARLSFICC